MLDQILAIWESVRNSPMLASRIAVVSLLVYAGCGSDERIGASKSPEADGGQPSGKCEPTALESRIESGSWDPRFTFPGFTGFDGYIPAVRGFARDNDGSLLATGYFEWVGQERVGALARLGEGVWKAARSDLPARSFSAVAVAPNRVALSTFVPLVPDPAQAKQTGTIYVNLGNEFRSIATFAGVVRALGWVGGRLWAAGFFKIDGNGSAGLAVWDETAGWSAAPGGAIDGPVYALLAEGNSVAIGGRFAHVGGIATRSVAQWNGTNWQAMSMEGSELPWVFGLARDAAGTLFAGGAAVPAGAPVGGVARWNGSAWEPVGAGFVLSRELPDLGGVVSDIAFHQGRLYAIGCLGATVAGNEDLGGVARFDGLDWEPLRSSADGPALAAPWFPGFEVCGNEPSGTAILEARFQRLYSDGSRLYVGGSFTQTGGVASQSLVAYDGEHWIAQGETSGLGLGGAADELAVGDPECGVYGLIPPATEKSVNATAYRFDGTTWTALPGNRPAGVLCSQLAVSPRGRVYLGCETPFGQDNPPTPPMPRLYEHDGSAWVTLGDIPSVTSGMVRDLVFDAHDRLWIVGQGFDRDLAPSGFIARLEDGTLRLVEGGFDGPVSELSFEPGESGRFVVGGGFTRVGAVSVARIAHWDGASWQPLGSGFDTPVSALAYAAGAIYASTTPGDTTRGTDVEWVLARWDGSRWTELGVPERGLVPHIRAAQGAKHQIAAMWVQGQRLVVAGGIFPEATDAVRGDRNVFVFDGERFAPLAGGVGAISVDSMAVTPDALYFGGLVATAGGGDAAVASIGIARFALGPSQ